MTLAAVIELREERLAELLDHVGEVKPLPDLGAAVQDSRDLCEGFEILDHLLLDVRTLHLHHHLPAVPQHGPMHLAERGRRQRSPVEFREGF